MTRTRLSARTTALLTSSRSVALDNFLDLGQRESLAVLHELTAMPRDVTLALAAEQRLVRVGILLADPWTVWQLADFAIAAGVKPGTPTQWRNKYLDTGEVDDASLVAPDVPTPRPYQPPRVGTGRGRSGRPSSEYAAPMWWARTGRLWLSQTGRVDQDQYPNERPGRVPPGRAPLLASPAA